MFTWPFDKSYQLLPSCVAEQLPNRESLFERPLLENCDRERVWNPNRVQFLDVWTELRGSTGICWFTTLQSCESRESCLPLTKCLHKLQFIVALVCSSINMWSNWKLVGHSQSANRWQIVRNAQGRKRNQSWNILHGIPILFSQFPQCTNSYWDFIANLCSAIYMLFL